MFRQQDLILTVPRPALPNVPVPVSLIFLRTRAMTQICLHFKTWAALCPQHTDLSGMWHQDFLNSSNPDSVLHFSENCIYLFIFLYKWFNPLWTEFRPFSIHFRPGLGLVLIGRLNISWGGTFHEKFTNHCSIPLRLCHTESVASPSRPMLDKARILVYTVSIKSFMCYVIM